MYVWKKHHHDLPLKPEERIPLGLLSPEIRRLPGRRRSEEAVVGSALPGMGGRRGSLARGSVFYRFGRGQGRLPL